MADDNGIGENTIFNVQVWMNNTVKRMQSKLAQSGSNNTGGLRQALAGTAKIEVKGGVLSTQIEGTDYWYMIDQGVRGKGGESDITGNAMPNQNTTSDASYQNKKPPLKDILNWVKTKLPRGGNDLFTALNVREGIYRKGTKGNKFASSVLTDERIKQLKETVIDGLNEDIIIAINGQID